MIRSSCSILLDKCGSLEEVKQIHAKAITQGLLPHLQNIACKILNTYAQFGNPTDAHNAFRQIHNPDLVSRTSLMSLYSQINLPHEAISIFSQIFIAGLKPDGFAIVAALSACGKIEDLGHGKLVHGMIYRLGLAPETYLDNALIDMYCRNGKIRNAHLVFAKMEMRDVVSWTSMLHGYIKCNDLASACRVFDEMPKRNTISWTAMITGFIQGKNAIRALELFRDMKLVGEDPSLITIVGVLSACADIGALDLGRSIHAYTNKVNMNLNTTICNALIDMYSKSGNVETAEKIFEGMSKKDVYSWTTMISGLAAHGNGSRANQIFSEMLRMGVSPNDITFVAILSACSHAGLVDEGRRWFNKMSEFYYLEPKIEHYGCMVDLLGRAGLLNEAEKLIQGMQIDPDAVIWRSLLSACLVHGNVELAEIVGRKVIELEPDDDGVYILIWNMYATADRWEEALAMRRMMKDRRVKKRPGCSWIEVNGVVHEFLVEDKMHSIRKEIYLVLEGISKHLRLDFSDSVY